jgi:hypothetical protein
MNVKRGVIVLSLLLLGLTLPLSFVYGNVPSVLEVEATADGDDTVLGLEISHSSPSSGHYVDSVEVRVDDGAAVAYGQDPQSSTRFSVEIVLEDASPTKVEVRSHCTSHGWSGWRVLELGDDEPEGNGGGIPGFPAGSLVLGLGVGLLLLWVTRKD